MSGASASEKEFQASLLRFVSGFAADPRRPIRATTPLFRTGLLDSLRILDLIAFIEVNLNIVIPDLQITAATFRSVKTISSTFWPTRADSSVASKGKQNGSQK